MSHHMYRCSKKTAHSTPSWMSDTLACLDAWARFLGHYLPHPSLSRPCETFIKSIVYWVVGACYMEAWLPQQPQPVGSTDAEAAGHVFTL